MLTSQIPDAKRFGGLRRARTLAVAVPSVLLALFAVTSILQRTWHGLEYVRAFSEAGLAGASAGWIALVSLFRRPFGLPLPHADLVSRHRERLTSEVAGYVSGRLLAPGNVSLRLREFGVAGRLARWLSDPANVSAVARGTRDLPASASALLGDERTRAAAREGLARGVAAIPAAPIAGRALTLLVTNGYHDALFDVSVEIAARYVDRHRSDLQRMGQNALPFSGFIGSLVFDGLTTELVAALASARRPNHPWRAALARSIESTIGALARDPAMAERAERIKLEVLSSATIDEALSWLAESLASRDPEATKAAIARGLAFFATRLESDAAMRETVDALAERLVITTLVTKREEIGAFVARRVASWKPEKLHGALDDAIGDDLAYLHLNATLAGALAGLVLFAVSRLL